MTTKEELDKITIRGTERLLFQNGQGFYKAILDKEDIEWINDISKTLKLKLDKCENRDYSIGYEEGYKDGKSEYADEVKKILKKHCYCADGDGTTFSETKNSKRYCAFCFAFKRLSLE